MLAEHTTKAHFKTGHIEQNTDMQPVVQIPSASGMTPPPEDTSNQQQRSEQEHGQGQEPAHVQEQQPTQPPPTSETTPPPHTASPPWKCTQCGIQKTPVKRSGPQGPHTLCNACGIRLRKKKKSSEAKTTPTQSIQPTVAPVLPISHPTGVWQCSQCGAQKTPVKRSGPQGPHTLCNACGIRLRKKKKAESNIQPQPSHLPSNQASSSLPQPSDAWKCTQCGIQKTPVKRSGPQGQHTLCNACGIHFSKRKKLIVDVR